MPFNRTCISAGGKLKSMVGRIRREYPKRYYGGLAGRVSRSIVGIDKYAVKEDKSKTVSRLP